MDEKSWKDALLSTGLPLEYSIRQTISQLGLTSGTEFSYLRYNEYGQSTEFSVDVSTSQIGLGGPVFFWVNYLIECKYRKEGTRWIFIPDKDESKFGLALRGLLPTLDQMTDGIKLDRKRFDRLFGRYVFAAKGCEVFGTDRNTQSIEQAVHQLRYAVPNGIRDALEHHVDHLLGHQNPVWTIMPIIVTTAELWCLREGTSIDAIKSSSDLSDVADQEEMLILHQPPDNLLTRYTRELLRESFDERQILLLDTGIRDGGFHGWKFFIEYCSKQWPSHFVVVTSTRFKDLLGNLLTLFNERALYKAKHNPSTQPKRNKTVRA